MNGHHANVVTFGEVPGVPEVRQELDVFWGDRTVGQYYRTGNGLEAFVYSRTYLERPDASPISHSLPLRTEPFARRKLRPFFAGLLPEGVQRSRLAGFLGLAEDDDFGLLAAVGGECAGAIAIVPHGTVPSHANGSVRPCGMAELADIIEALPFRPMLAGEHGLRLSLAGAQSKLPVVFDDMGFSLPENGAPSTHILKPELPGGFPGVASNEHCCMSLARGIGLNVAKTSLLEIGGHPCLLVERFDRRRVNGEVRRIHQEDFCQALGVPPERKYQIEGGPLARDVVRLMRDGWSTAPAADIIAFIDLTIFNAIIGNADAHAKNHSMIYDGGSRRLAPGYDLVSTVAWPQLDKAPAMKIGGAESINAVDSGHWRKFSQEIGVSATALIQRVMRRCEDVLKHTPATLGLPDSCEETLLAIQLRASAMISRVKGGGNLSDRKQ